MADLKVEVTTIGKISEHPNADRMEIVNVGSDHGWQTCVKKGIFSEGDKVIYFPVDCILPMDVEKIIFGEDAKVTLKNHRVKTIKLRGAISQGFVVPIEELGFESYIKVGVDVAEKLGVTKYEPPQKGSPQMQGQQTKKKFKNPFFKEYTSINHFKYYEKAMEDYWVVVTEKIHGTNFRAGQVPYNDFNLIRKIKKFFGKPFGLWQWEFAYGSHRVQLTDRSKDHKGFYDTNVYWKTVEQYNLKEIIDKGYVIYGEIYGFGIQKGYAYGCKEGETRLAVFDVMKDGKYLSHHQMVRFCQDRKLPMVPFMGKHKYDYETLNTLANSESSQLDVMTKPIEGIVVKPQIEENGYMGRMIFKWISDEYYMMKNNTEYH